MLPYSGIDRTDCLRLFKSLPNTFKVPDIDILIAFNGQLIILLKMCF